MYGDANLFAKKLLLKITNNYFQDGRSWSKLLKNISHKSAKLLETFRVNLEKEYFATLYWRRTWNLTHLFPIHLFSTPWKHQKTVRFSDVFGG